MRPLIFASRRLAANFCSGKSFSVIGGKFDFDVVRQVNRSALYKLSSGFFSVNCYLFRPWPWPAAIFPPPTEWGYSRKDGPPTWLDKYPPARGSNQSPIDFPTARIQSAPELGTNPLTYNYEGQVCKGVRNTGCGWRVDFEPSDTTGLNGGPLENNYELVQFHCHWGQNTEHGSEHTVDGQPYVGELHFVHWDKDTHGCCADAVSVSKGLAVIGVFLEIGDPNPEMEKLCEAIKNIPFKDQTAELPEDFSIKPLFPDDLSYWTYDGSLTTPPCYESVTWIVYKKPITVSEEQLEHFRSMHSHGEEESIPDDICCGQVKLNFRPPQELNERSIREYSHT